MSPLQSDKISDSNLAQGPRYRPKTKMKFWVPMLKVWDQKWQVKNVVRDIRFEALEGFHDLRFFAFYQTLNPIVPFGGLRKKCFFTFYSGRFFDFFSDFKRFETFQYDFSKIFFFPKFSFSLSLILHIFWYFQLLKWKNEKSWNEA